jgi:MORN repeat
MEFIEFLHFLKKPPTFTSDNSTTTLMESQPSVVINYDDDDDDFMRLRYEGQVLNKVPWGNGTMTYKNGETYSGQWSGGIKHGFGVQSYPRCQYYETCFLSSLTKGYNKLECLVGDARSQSKRGVLKGS